MTTVITDTTARDLLLMDTQEFETIVNADTRSRLVDTPAIAAALRADPEVTRRWYTTLMTMHKSLEGQLASKTADNSAKIGKLKLKRASWATIVEEETSFEQWRAGALRVKNGLELKLIEAKSILERRGDRFIINAAAKERNAAFGRIGVLEDAIRRHKAALVAEDTEPSSADENLWEYIVAS